MLTWSAPSRLRPKERDPFPHVIAHGIFPAELYQEMLALLPDDSQYEAFAYEKHSTEGASNRGRFRIDRYLARPAERPATLAVAGRSRRARRRRIQECRLSKTVRWAGISVQPLGGKGQPRAGLSAAGAVSRDFGLLDQAAPRHAQENRDDADCAAGRRRPTDLGTQFYRRSLNPLHLFREPRGFEVAKQAPFLPNVAYAFAVIDAMSLKSWHGRTTLAGEAGVRTRS